MRVWPRLKSKRYRSDYRHSPERQFFNRRVRHVHAGAARSIEVAPTFLKVTVYPAKQLSLVILVPIQDFVPGSDTSATRRPLRPFDPIAPIETLGDPRHRSLGERSGFAG